MHCPVGRTHEYEYVCVRICVRVSVCVRASVCTHTSESRFSVICVLHMCVFVLYVSYVPYVRYTSKHTHQH